LKRQVEIYALKIKVRRQDSGALTFSRHLPTCFRSMAHMAETAEIAMAFRRRRCVIFAHSFILENASTAA
jgi:hypothetical protein